MPETYQVKLLGKRQVADRTMEFSVEKPADLVIKAGQYLDIVLPLSEDIPEEARKHGFSLVSSPYENFVALATRMRNGSAFKKNFQDTPDGTVVGLIAPFGDFTLHNKETTPAVFIAGGIGVTPVRSIVRQATYEKKPHKITLIYSNRTPQDAAYTEDFEQLAQENPHFTFVPIYSKTQGHVNVEIIKQNVPDIDAPRYYISGPEGFVGAMRALLEEVGADMDNVRGEEFEGYL